MIVVVREDCNTLSFTWSSSSPRSWNIQVQQLSCAAAWRPQEGCLQWVTGTSGSLQSYNYRGGLHLASHYYNICIRTEQVQKLKILFRDCVNIL